MDDFSRYEKMRDAGSTPGQVHEAGKADGLDRITMIRLLRRVFDLSLADAKRATGAGEGFDARPVIRVGDTVHWEVFGPEEDPCFMEANVASIDGETAHLDRMKKFRLKGDGEFAEVPLDGPDQGELAVSHLERSLVERLDDALRARGEPVILRN